MFADVAAVGQGAQRLDQAELGQQRRAQVGHHLALERDALVQRVEQAVEAAAQRRQAVGRQRAHDPAGVELGGREQGTELVVQLARQACLLGFAGVGQVAGEAAEFLRAVGDLGVQALVLRVQQLRHAFAQAVLTVQHHDQHQQQRQHAGAEHAVHRARVGKACEGTVLGGVDLGLGGGAQRQDASADVVGDLLAGAAVGLDGRGWHAALDRLGEQAPAHVDQQRQMVDGLALAFVRPRVCAQRAQRGFEPGLALLVGPEIHRVAGEQVAAHARLGVEHLQQQGVEVMEPNRARAQVLECGAARLGLPLARDQPRQPEHEAQQQHGDQQARAWARQAGGGRGQGQGLRHRIHEPVLS